LKRRLLVVSHTPHYIKNGVVTGWGPTIREIDHLSELFDEVVHIAPVHSNAPSSAIAYESSRVRLRAIRPSGGERLQDKLSIFWQSGSYIKAIMQEASAADVLHIRCPANVSLIAILLMGLLGRPAIKWVKYAGNWRPEGVGDALSYRFQRWWLEKCARNCIVTINGEWPDQPSHVRSFLNPCLTRQELEEGETVSNSKSITTRVRLLFAGRLEPAKGVECVLETAVRLLARKMDVTLDFVGDGPLRGELEALVKSHGIERAVRFHGWMPRRLLGKLYAEANFILLPTDSEGWPKVLSEAMAYGVVPLASAVSCIPQYLDKFKTGRAFPVGDTAGFVDAIQWYANNPDIWEAESRNAVDAARQFTYSVYVHRVNELLEFKPDTQGFPVPTGPGAGSAL
jgi:glycosyltransferase involved in cell wall biosynthesis